MNRFLLLFSILIIPVLAQAQESIPKDALVAHYSFDGHAFDVSGHGNHGEAFGPTPTEDRFGNLGSAYFFDGTDYIDTHFSFDKPVRSISVWFRFDSENLETLSEQNLFDQDSHELEYGVWRISLRSNQFSMLDGGGHGRLDKKGIIEPFKWHHAVITKENSLVCYYLNGELVGKTPIDNVGSTNNPYENLIIGSNRERDRKFFVGAIDDIQIFKYALTESMVQVLYSKSGWLLLEDSARHPGDSTEKQPLDNIPPPPHGLASSTTNR